MSDRVAQIGDREGHCESRLSHFDLGVEWFGTCPMGVGVFLA